MATPANAAGRVCSQQSELSLPLSEEEDDPLLLATEIRSPMTAQASSNRRLAQPMVVVGAVAVIMVLLLAPHTGESDLDKTVMLVSQIRQQAIRSPACKTAQGRQQRDHQKKLNERHGLFAKHCPPEIVSGTLPNCNAPGATTDCTAACRSVASFESDRIAACVESGERCTFDYGGPKGETHWEDCFPRECHAVLQDMEKETRDSFHNVGKQCEEGRCSVMLKCGL
eukprot:CAMPEP_0172791066 /NCGR_PEP_ID=MMETSP1074-20121228/208282_1 /TAXON_ID=2916 /ORGANISM="Ceratium fusus, Strain PA161109" /LENGTH=225 /DNA_ID=CAMNT_0013628121 /DNA_START=51 /DNA_END=728 /DNA_ORIENTATION=+